MRHDRIKVFWVRGSAVASSQPCHGLLDHAYYHYNYIEGKWLHVQGMAWILKIPWVKWKGRTFQYDRERAQTCFIFISTLHTSRCNGQGEEIARSRFHVPPSLLIGRQIYSTCKKQLEGVLHGQQSMGINSSNEMGKVKGRNDLCPRFMV